MTERDGIQQAIDAFGRSKKNGAITRIRPSGSALGLLPFGPQWILLVVVFLARRPWSASGPSPGSECEGLPMPRPCMKTAPAGCRRISRAR